MNGRDPGGRDLRRGGGDQAAVPGCFVRRVRRSTAATTSCATT